MHTTLISPESRSAEDEKSSLPVQTSSRDLNLYTFAKHAQIPKSSSTRAVSSTWTRIWRHIFFTIIFFGILFTLVKQCPLPYTPPWLKDAAYSWMMTPWNACGSALDDWNNFYDAPLSPDDIPQDSRVLAEIPQYVLDYAPYVHLFSGEEFWPCDIAEHLHHITPELDYTPIEGSKLPPPKLNLTNLDKLNEFEKGRHVYLTSNDNVEERPEWLAGEKNIPDSFDDEAVVGDGAGSRAPRRKMHPDPVDRGGRSDAPAVLVTVNKGNGVVDAFWFYFYSYNLGNVVLNVRWGNHVGDWEHSLVRFQHGKPKLVFFSEHNFGSAYSYAAVEKVGKRPVVYSAVGTHAMYATPGFHPYVLPLGLLHDETDRGPLWDPALNVHTYTYNPSNDIILASIRTPEAPTQWFYFAGHWGDKFYPLNDDRQYGLVGEYHYVNGPLGPRFKNLGRRKVCQGRYEDPCEIRHWIVGEGAGVGFGEGEGEDWPDGEGEVMPPPVL